MAPPKVKAAAVQLSPVLSRRDGTVEKVMQKIHELGQRGVQFAVSSETLVPSGAACARTGDPR
jgi:aliphatic nitrilase